MFRLKRLEIHGFKSFVDKTSVTLPSRLTAIVGPNGSGKSNICDAVMWVLGEQSARVLRGTSMEDVIFNGAARRKPLGSAEVSLTLESRGGTHWAETGGEVTITRRVTRDGESDYILNGKRSRLKDVQDLLLGTGLGVRAYAIIEQQKIDLILSAKPQDRRRLIEEAAGVSKYKIRKRQAEVKLEETRANLLRITDIVSEIERTCASLKRQASRAARWKEQAEALAAAKRTLLRLRADRLAEGLAAAAAALAAAVDAEAASIAAAARLEAAFEETRRLADEDDRVRRERGDALARAREALLAAEAAVTAAERDAEEAQARQELLEAQRAESEADHLREAAEAGRAAQARDEIEAALASAEEAARAAGSALSEAVRREDELARRREASRRDLLASGARVAEAANRERDGALLVERLGFALTKLTERRERADLLLSQRRSAVASAEAAEALTAVSLEGSKRRLDEIGVGRRAAEEALKELSAQRDAAQARFHGLDRRVASLETTLAARESGGEAARAALAAAGLPTPPVLADHFEAAEGFEKALDAALGLALEAPVVSSRQALLASLSAVSSAGLGTARFVHPIPDTPFPLKPIDDRVLGVARELLAPKPGDEALASALPDAVVVGSVEDALALAPLHPERTLVTRDGVVVRGSVVEAAGTEVPGEGLFTVRRDLKALSAEREALSARLGELGGEIAGTRELSGALAADLEREFAAMRRAEREHSEALTRLNGAKAELARAEQELRILDEEETTLSVDLQRAREAREEAARLVAARQAEVTAVESAIAEQEAATEEARAARRTAETEDAACRSERDLLKERRRAASEAHEGHRARAEAAARRLSDAVQSHAELGRRREEALGRGEEARAARAAAVAEAEAAEESRREADRAAEERHLLLEAADREAHASRERLDAARRERFEAELLVERRKADREHLVESARTEFGCLPEELPAVTAAEGEEPPDEAALAERVSQMTLTLERLGPVNHAALEEFDVESKRLQEIATQKLDLELSLEQILETIRTINATSSLRFQEAFVAINAGFAQVFQRLFRGGSASMQLLDEDDPLESGLEIMAQPPGKRNQTIGLLSGGEKALTAVALLISIFKYKPAPFCILDEVDAPLDEANIDRFTALLHELSEETQFVLITHSKRTMEAAQALYGVTQEEPGVSKIVSVRFD